MRLDVRVTDAAGRPVKDIRADEIEVLENGRRRPVVLFQHIEEPDAPVAEAARRTVASEVSTNRGAPRGHLYVIVFDQHHITPGREQRARIAAEKFLRNHLRQGDRAALFGLPGPGPQVPFTGDTRRLIEALPRVRGGLERSGFGAMASMSVQEAYEVVRGNDLVLARVIAKLQEQAAGTDLPSGNLVGRVGARTEDAAIVRQLVKEDARTITARANEDARRSLVMLSDVIRELQGIEGRKSIILLSEGFYGDDVSRELELVAAAAARAYAVIYSLDLARRTIDPTDTEPAGANPMMEVQDRISPLGGLAAETDGLLFFDANSALDTAFARIAQQSLDYYIVGFEPGPGTDETQYRRVTVRVTRDGVRTSARSGYAIRAALPNPADRRRAINAALGAPFPQQGVPIEFTTYIMRGTSSGTQKVVMSLAADLPVARAGDQQAADVVFVVRSQRDGRVVASGTDALPLPSAARNGVSTSMYRVQFDLPAGEYLMRAVVREPRGTIGSADRRFEVRPIDLRTVSASDLILGGVEGGLPVRPTARAGGALGGVIELYARDAETLQDVTVAVDLAPIGSRMFAGAVPAALLDVQRQADTWSRGASVQVPLDRVAPGEYVARARIMHRGQLVAELAREIRVLDPAMATTR